MSDANGNGSQPPSLPPVPPAGFGFTPLEDHQPLDVPTLVEMTMMHCSFEVRTLRDPVNGRLLRFKSPNGITFSVPLSEEVAKALGRNLMGDDAPKIAIAKGSLPKDRHQS